ncbi:MAG: hypothetical protein MUD00_02040 [Candidatus Pacebacteria bacterium]|jgi:Tfp pilus assembly protein PilV|nr:hypothetical protein [Candidatus Paceibacterota bacterium]
MQNKKLFFQKTKSPLLPGVWQTRKQQNTASGFTIIETLVALSLFTFAILGLIVITSQGISDVNFAKNKLTASYLSQEGIETVRSIRDSRVLAGESWQAIFSTNALTGLGNCTVTAQSNGCDIDAYTLAIDTCATASRAGCGPLHYDSATGAFRIASIGQSFPASAFNRVISLSEVSPQEVRVTSTVTWDQGTNQKSVTMTETLFNWATVTPLSQTGQ